MKLALLGLLLISLALSHSKPSKVIIKTCSACKLSRLPILRNVVYYELDPYENIFVEFVPQHKPTAFLLDSDGKEVGSLVLGWLQTPLL